jgi:WD40 repeat protein
MKAHPCLIADGVVRLYRNYDPHLEQGPVQMVSSYRVLNELIQVRQGSGVILDWKQSGGSLLAGGDSRIIRVWDAHTETQLLVTFDAVQCLHSLIVSERIWIPTQIVLPPQLCPIMVPRPRSLPVLRTVQSKCLIAGWKRKMPS